MTLTASWVMPTYSAVTLWPSCPKQSLLPNQIGLSTVTWHSWMFPLIVWSSSYFYLSPKASWLFGVLPGKGLFKENAGAQWVSALDLRTELFCHSLILGKLFALSHPSSFCGKAFNVGWVSCSSCGADWRSFKSSSPPLCFLQPCALLVPQCILRC